MQTPQGIIDEEGLPDSANPRFIRVLRSLPNRISPSKNSEALRAYERMWLLQACADAVLSDVQKRITEDFDKWEYPSYPSIHLEKTIREFMKEEGFDEWSQALPPEELEIVIGEVIQQVEAQGIAWFDSLEDDLLWTSMSFIRA